MVKWHVPNAEALKPVNARQQNAKVEPKAEAKIGRWHGAKAEPKSEANPVPPPETKGVPAPEADTLRQPEPRLRLRRKLKPSCLLM
jgi:hypothetical protein